MEPLAVGRDAHEFQEPSAFAWCGPNKQRENCRVGENYWRDKGDELLFRPIHRKEGLAELCERVKHRRPSAERIRPN